MSAKRILIAIIIIILLSLSSCSSLFGEAVRYRITVEDQSGNKLGSGVWETKMWWSVALPVYESSLIGQAFPITLPDGEEQAFVAMGRAPRSNPYWYGPADLNARSIMYLAFKAALKKKEVSEKRPASEYGSNSAKKFGSLRRFQGRAEIIKDRLFVVTFADVNDPETVKKLSESFYGKLRFFVEITSDPISTGIEKHLPWIVEFERKNISGLDGLAGRQGGERDPLSDKLLISDFKTSAWHPVFTRGF